MGEAPQERLDSWKAIADYLQRDVATVRRWEKASGLPVRRMPGPGGAPGRSVFAYVSEIEAWLKATPPAGDVAAGPGAARAVWRRWGVAATVPLVILTAFLWGNRLPSVDSVPSSVQVTPEGVIALDSAGQEQWKYRFPAGERGLPLGKNPERVNAAGQGRGILAATAYSLRTADDVAESGRLMWFTPGGALVRSASIEDRVGFTSATYGPPWIITDHRIDERGGAARIALAAHHQTWWPSVVTVLDERLQRRGTFVNAGWVEWVRWVSPDRLLITGFSNPRDGGMVALLDAGALDGQSPADAGSEFRCATCGPGSPIRYIVLPRSEVNRVTASPFNGASPEMAGDRLLVHTVEVPLPARAVDALYEFSPSLDLLRASFSDRYWEVHQALEKEGKISHTRADCPDRDGPRAIEMWEPQAGWRTLRTRH